MIPVVPTVNDAKVVFGAGVGEAVALIVNNADSPAFALAASAAA